MKNIRKVLCLVLIVSFICSNNIYVLAANDSQEESSSIKLDTDLSEVTINLKGLSKSEVKKIFKKYALEYDSQMKYDKIVIEQPKQETRSLDLANLKSDYSGKRYRIVNTYGNKPIATYKKGGKAAYDLYSKVDKGTSIAVGLLKPYIWIPYTALGINPSNLFNSSDPKQYIMTSVYTHLETRRVDFYKNAKWQPSGFVQKATITDTTTAYYLKDKAKKVYAPITKDRTIIRKAAHYDDTNYLLKKSYYSFMHDLPSFSEQV